MLTEEQLQDIFELADLLSNGNRDLFIQLREIVFSKDPNDILDSIEQTLEPDSFDDFLDRVGESETENLWLILTKLLEHLNYICVYNHRDELQEFVHSFDRLQQVRNTGISLQLDSEGLNVADSMPKWAAVIDRKYASEGYCLGAIDMDTESYYLFFAKVSIFNRLRELANNIGYRIDYAKYM
ncbi:DUF6630 family protein [Streptococcus ruminantium]|uniref:DUF6630 family protein n=1 Tax=Streptococcus ruminantium TaxID=1917441 RepID=UPI0012DF06E3|nr:DUF6630 family protein [Streptococcus ruminantium]